MPIQVRKIKNKNLYSVKNTQTGQVHSYGTTKTKAESQKRLLTALETGGRGTDPEVILQMKQMMQEAKKKKTNNQR